MAAIVISFVSLAISIIAVVYVARNVAINERRLRGESDAAKTTRFEISISNRMIFMLDDSDIDPYPHNISARNIGETDARDVELLVNRKTSDEEWAERSECLLPKDSISVSLGKFTGEREYIAEVSWKDSRFLRQSYKKTVRTW